MAITIETFLLPMARDLRDRGWVVEGAAAGLAADLEPFAATHDLELSRDATDIRRHGRAVRTLRALFRDGDYDVVHLHTPVAAALARTAVRTLPRRARPAVVYTAHGFHFYDGAPRSAHAYALVERALAPTTDIVFTINREDHERATRLFACPVHHLPGVGIDLDHYRADAVTDEAVTAFLAGEGLLDAPGTADHRPFTILVVAALDPGKRHERLLRALAQWEDRVTVLLAGTGPERGRIEARSRNLGLGRSVHFLGSVDDIRVPLRAADCVVLPSEREGLPRSVLEAMAMGTPVLASDIRGARDLLSDGAGLLVDTADPAAFREAIDRMAHDPALRAALVERAAERVQEHAQDRVLALHGAVLDTLDPRQAATVRPPKRPISSRLRGRPPRAAAPPDRTDPRSR